jgi:hypothetical protein
MCSLLALQYTEVRHRTNMKLEIQEHLSEVSLPSTRPVNRSTAGFVNGSLNHSAADPK